MNPSTFLHIFPQVFGIVHTLGTLFEGSNYKKAVREGDILGFLGAAVKGAIGVGGGNPLEKLADGATKGSYESVNRDAGEFLMFTLYQKCHFGFGALGT